VAKVVHDRLPGIDRQGQPVDPRSLAVNHDLARPPIDVVERQRGDLAATQPQSGQQHQDRVIAAPGRCRPITTVKQPRHLPDRQRAREILPPPRDRRHRLGERLGDQPVHVQEPQQRPQRVDHRLRRPDRAPARLPQHEHADVGSRQTRESVVERHRALGQEQPRGRLILRGRARLHPPLPKQILPELPEQPINQRGERVVGRQHAEPVQIAEQPAQAQRRETLQIPLPPAPDEIPLQPVRRQRRDLEPFGLHPPAHMRQQIQLLLRTPQRVALLEQTDPEPIGEPHQRPAHPDPLGRWLIAHH